MSNAAHIVVVPVSTLDAETSEALSFAGRLAPAVLAVHICQPHDPDGLQAAWSQTSVNPPLIVVDSAGHDDAQLFNRTLQVLLRAEALKEITVVVPAQVDGSRRVDWRDGLQSSGSVVVRRMP